MGLNGQRGLCPVKSVVVSLDSCLFVGSSTSMNVKGSLRKVIVSLWKLKVSAMVSGKNLPGVSGIGWASNS